MKKTKIFVSAFSCMPHMGSEPGVGWHWIMEMSKYFELWVLVHKEPVDDIEKYVKEHGIDKKIHFIYYDIPGNSLFFKNGKFRWVRTYYMIWTALANRIVKRTMQENGIKIFHNLTFGNAIWPVSKFGQKQFFIWGPIGGIETIPADYSCHYNTKSRIIEWVRRTMAKTLRWNLGFNRRCKNADLMLCKTEAMRMAIPEKYRHKAVLFTDVAVEPQTSTQQMGKAENKVLQYISVGRLDAWRGFDILIESFCEALQVYPNMKLSILGDGADRKRLESIIEKNQLNNSVFLLGNVSIAEYNRIISTCDVVVNSCLKEGAVTVSFDSMRYGKPLICVDSGGFTRYFSNEYAIVLPQQSRRKLIQSMKKAILDLTDKNQRHSMGELARNVGNQFTWDIKGEKIYEIITNFHKQ